MTQMRTLERRMWTMLAESTPKLEAKFAATIAAPARLHARLRFSAFLPEHAERAMAVVDGLMAAADSVEGPAGLAKSLDLAERLRETEGPELVNHALLVFTTHHPKGRFLARSVPPLAVREPEKILTGTEQTNYRGQALPVADGLEWFREDPFANEHHEHWHVVYPTRGVPDGHGGRTVKDRQGELFLYMHQQMLARYDAERVAIGLERVKSFSAYREPVQEGYQPGEAFASFSQRPPGRTWQDLALPGEPPYSVTRHESLRDRLMEAVETRKYAGQAATRAVDVDSLGSTVEPTSPGSVDLAFYGNHHGRGHILTACVEDPTGQAAPGVMADPATAIRDPFFFRWHKHIDDLYRRWQDQFPSHELSDRPHARMRKSYSRTTDTARSPDIHLAFVDTLPAGAESDLSGYAARAFGGDRWDVEDASALGTTTELQTWMATQPVLLPDRKQVDIEQLVHREVCWFFRLENLAPRHTTVTVRVFLVPRSLANDRWAWIEMDKFLHELAPNERTVVARRGRESSVVRKPASMMPRLLLGPRYRIDEKVILELRGRAVPEPVLAVLAALVGQVFETDAAFFEALQERLTEDDLRAHQEVIFDWAFLDTEKPLDPFLSDGTVDPHADLDVGYCTCGWPYNLLFPRGHGEGMPFRVAVVLTDWDIDRTGPDSSCGSLSFCGAMDRYPDRRPMLYPFDRPLATSVSDTIMSQPNMAFTDLRIRHLGSAPR